MSVRQRAAGLRRPLDPELERQLVKLLHDYSFGEIVHGLGTIAWGLSRHEENDRKVRKLERYTTALMVAFNEIEDPDF